MLTFLGENYFIDLEELESRVNLSKDYIPSGESEQQISVVKYDIYKNLIEVILTEREEMDENLGIHNSNNLTIPFKIAFNTLLINSIIKKF
jgi:hypothetical protein